MTFMIHSTLLTDFSPPGSNEEAVNSPQSVNQPIILNATKETFKNPPLKRFASPITQCATSSIRSNYNISNSNYIKLNKYDSSDLPDKEEYWNSSPGPSPRPFKTHTVTQENKRKKYDIENVDKLTTVPSTCKVCGDKATAVYYRAMVCASCRGFFRRSIKNDKAYVCSLGKNCIVNKKTRNHCQGCRIEHCYKVGMSRPEVETELAEEKIKRQEKKKAKENLLLIDLSVIAAAELFVDPKIEEFANVKFDPIRQLCLAADKQLASLAEWAKRMPYFTGLQLHDQVKLLQWNWAELLIGGFCYRSSAVSDGILLSTGLHLSRENLEKAGVGNLVNKLFSEVINKMQKLQIDITEWGCLRAIMLFAPDTKELSDTEAVENIRACYVATLCSYIKKTYPNDPQRLSNLLLRLPPLKAIALQVLEHLFFFKILGDVPIDTFLLEMLDTDGH